MLSEGNDPLPAALLVGVGNGCSRLTRAAHPVGPYEDENCGGFGGGL